MTGDWRDYRLAIWLAMIAVAVALLVSPWLVALPVLGGAIGAALAVRRRHVRLRASAGRRIRGGPGPSR